MKIRYRAIANILLIAVSFSHFTLATPIVTFPIKAQIPPVARVGRPFHFAFDESTYTYQGAVRYSLQSQPEWLQLDASGKAFQGKPSIYDVGTVTFDLIAADETGNVSQSVTLVVVMDGGLEVATPLSAQLPPLGTFSSPDALLLYPSHPIKISFSQVTFRGANEKTVYYATCTDNTPLPPWLQFDGKSLSFTGTTPAFNSPQQLPQDFSIRLIASNIPGYAEAVDNFRLIVARHELTFNTTTFTLNTNIGNAINIDLSKILALDGSSVNVETITLITHSDMPHWLSVDNSSLHITGTVPLDGHSTTFMIAARDGENDTANLTVAVSIPNNPKSILEPFTLPKVVLGEPYYYQFNRSRFNESLTGLAMNLGECSSWLNFNSDTLVLAGEVNKLQTCHLRLDLQDGAIQEEMELILQAIPGVLPSSTNNSIGMIQSTTTRSYPDASIRPTTQPSTKANSDDGTDRSRIVAGTLIPIFAITVILLLFLCLTRRRQRARKPPIKAADVIGSCLTCARKLKIEKHWISKPVLREDATSPWHDNEKLIRPCQRAVEVAPRIPDRNERRPPVASQRSDALQNRPFTPPIQRSSFQDGVMNAMRRHSWAAKWNLYKHDSSPQRQNGSKVALTIAEERPPIRSRGQLVNTTGSLSDIRDLHTAKGSKCPHTYKQDSHRVASPISRSPSGLGHGKIPSMSSKNSAALFGNRVSLPSVGLGHGKGRVSDVNLPSPAHLSWRNTSIYSMESSGWMTTSETSENTEGNSSTAASCPPRDGNSNPVVEIEHIRKNDRSTIRLVSSSRKRSSSLKVKKHRTPEHSRLLREQQQSRILREGRQRDSSFFASSTASDKHSSYRHTSFGHSNNLATTSALPLIETRSNASTHTAHFSQPSSGHRFATSPSSSRRGHHLRPSVSSMHSSRQTHSRLSPSKRYRAGYGQPPRPLVKLPSQSSIGGMTTASSDYSSEAPIELIEETAGEDDEKRIWKQKQDTITPESGGKGKVGGELRRAVLRESIAQRPRSILASNGGSHWAENRSMETNRISKGALEKAFI